MSDYDALLVLSFGGPECRDDVIPFLENVLRGKNVPRERMLQVAEHYYHFGGISPINQQNRELISALTTELAEKGPSLPIYWGNRNWHPFLTDTLRKIQSDGKKRVLTLITSTFSSYSGCRQYREDIERSRAEIGEGAPQVDKIRGFYNHPGFIAACLDRIHAAINTIPAERQSTTLLVFTAHSIPLAMAKGCKYEEQLNETCRLLVNELNHRPWRLVYQSRSGPPGQPWLEPDILDSLREIKSLGTFTDVVVIPIGFVSDHMEVLFDLDTEALQLCEQLGINMVRAKTVGTHPRFITMVRELIVERIEGQPPQSLGSLPPCPDVCPTDCCLSGRTMPPSGRP